jgi:hypothetical protein
MEVCFSAEMGAPGASHLGTGDHGPKTDRIRPRSVPVSASVVSDAPHWKNAGRSGTSCGARPIQLFEGSRPWGGSYAN